MSAPLPGAPAGAPLTVPAPLAGRTVLVTGASRGIGAATARVLHRDGATVVAGHRDSARAVRALAEELGERLHPVRADLTEPGGADALWDAAREVTGGVDVLVNNAGAWLASPLEDRGAWQRGWSANLALNLTSAADLCRRAVLDWRGGRGGVLVTITSRSAHRGDDVDHLAYGAAKGGLLALTRGIARGCARDGVLAYAIAPGWVATDLAADHLAAADASSLPLGEATPPGDVAEVVAFLASGRSRHTTGATIDVTGADYVR